MSLSTPLFLIINSTTQLVLATTPSGVNAPLVFATTPSGVNVTRLGDADL